MILPSRERLRFDYFDASNDPLAGERCAVPEGVHRELGALDCEHLGYTLAILRLNRMELVHDIWTSDDRRCFVELASRTGRAELVTLFEDGSIARTAAAPAGALARLELRAGTMPSHRRDRFVVEFERGPLANVLARHRERVAATERTSPVVSADSMQTYFATRLRQAELRDARMFWHLLLGELIAFVVALGAAITLLRLAFGPHRHDDPHRAGHALLAVIAAWVVYLPARYVAKWFVAPLVVRLLPGPKARPAVDLLDTASRVRPGRVWRY